MERVGKVTMLLNGSVAKDLIQILGYQLKDQHEHVRTPYLPRYISAARQLEV